MAERLRVGYLADTRVDVRHLEGLAPHVDLQLIVPARLGARATNFWPPRDGESVERTDLPGGRVGFAIRAAFWLWRHRRRVDVVFVLDNLTAALGANVARRLGGPAVVLQIGRPTVEYVRCQRGRYPALLHRLKVALTTVLVALNERLADGIGAVSAHCAAQCARHNETVVTIPAYGVDVERFAPRWTREDARRRLGLPLDEPVVLWRSRVAPEKDPETFLRAVDQLRRAGRTICAVYMGGEVDDMRRIADACGVDVVARRPADADEIPLWYAAADVDVQTSHAEGLGISPLEALACGTPIVVTDVGGLPEVADGGRVGHVVPPGDVEATAAAIAALLDDPQQAAAMVAAGRRWVCERFRDTDAFAAWAALAARVVRRVADDRPVRVLFIDHETRLSGGERELVDLVRALGPRVDAHVAVPDDGPFADALREAGALVHLVPMAASLRQVSRWDLARRPHLAVGHLVAAAAAWLRIARLARRVRPAVIHTNSMKAHVLAAGAGVAGRAPVLWHVRDILEPGWVQRAFAVAAGRIPRRVVCISAAVAAPFGEAAARGRATVLYDGVVTAEADPADVSEWRRRLRCGDGPLIGIVGQLARWKGQDVFVEAAAMVAEQCPDARFAIVGECLFPANEQSFVADVRVRADALGLADRLVWTGAVEPVEPLIGALDVLVHASRLPEPFGRVIVEAMAQGTPVVTTTLGAGPELVRGAGVVVPAGDAAALAEAIVDLVHDDDRRRMLGAAGRAAAARFDIRRTADEVVALYREVAG